MTLRMHSVAAVCALVLTGGCATVDKAVEGVKEGAGKTADAVKETFKKRDEPTPPATAQAGPAIVASGQTAQPKPADRQQVAKAPSRATENTIGVDHQCAIQQSTFSIMDSFKERATVELVLRVSDVLAKAGAQPPMSSQDQQTLREYSRTVIWIPGELESLLGDFRFKDLQKTGNVVPKEDDDANDADKLFEPLQRVTGNGLPFPLKLAVVTKGTSEAVSIPGGYVVVNQSWLTTTTRRQAITLMMAHEIAHIMKRHETKEFQVKVISTREGYRLFKSIFEAARARVSGRGAPAGFQSVFSGLFEIINFTSSASQLWTEMRNVQVRYVQDQEIEADACAVRLLRDAKSELNAWNAWKMYRQFAYQGADTAEASTHPTSADREAKLECMTRTDANSLTRCGAPAAKPTLSKPTASKPAGKPPAIKPPVQNQR